MVKEVVGSYIKDNMIRIVEITAIVVIAFTTMQYNVNLQGEILKRVVDQQEQQNIILSNLTVTVAELSIRLASAEEDISEMHYDLKHHMINK